MRNTGRRTRSRKHRDRRQYNLARRQFTNRGLEKVQYRRYEAEYIQINRIVGKLTSNKKATEENIKKAEFEFMMDMKTLISKTAIDPELTRVRTKSAEKTKKPSRTATAQSLTSCQSDGAWYRHTH